MGQLIRQSVEVEHLTDTHDRVTKPKSIRRAVIIGFAPCTGYESDSEGEGDGLDGFHGLGREGRFFSGGGLERSCGVEKKLLVG